MEVVNVFTLGRTIDVTYPSNRWLLTIVVVASLFIVLYTGDILRGLLVGLGFFLCWALSRELDPAHDLSAFLAGGLYLLFTIGFSGMDVAVLFWLILLLRLLSGICGKSPTLLDLGVVFGLTAYLVYHWQTPAFLFLYLLALLLAWPRYPNRLQLGVVALVAALLIPPAAWLWPLRSYAVSSEPLVTSLVVLTLLLFSSLHIFSLARDKGIVDDEGRPLASYWIQRAHLFFSISFLTMLFLTPLTVNTYLLLFSSLSGVVLYRGFLWLGKTVRLGSGRRR